MLCKYVSPACGDSLPSLIPLSQQAQRAAAMKAELERRLVRAVLQQGCLPSLDMLGVAGPALLERCRSEWGALQVMRATCCPPTEEHKALHPEAAAQWAAELGLGSLAAS